MKHLNKSTNNHNLMKKLHEQEKICAWEITAKQAELFNELYESGLSEPENMHFGLDGHGYELRLLGKDVKYECWQVLPKEWVLLGKLIDEYLINAGLDADQEKYGYVIK